MDNIIKFVKNELINDHSGHDFKHCLRVVNNAKKIIKYEGGDYNIIITSCYLHDVVDKKLFSNIENQINKVRNLLADNQYNNNEIDEIIDIITSISYNNGQYKELTSLNSMIVRDADRLDALGSLGIIRTIEYGHSKNRQFYDENNLKYENNHLTFNQSTDTTLSHFYDKLLKLEDLMLTTEGKKIAKERMKVIQQFLKSFYEELE